MTGFNSSVITQPFNVSVVTNNGNDELRRLVAPSWVSTANIRGSSEILQSCILTLVACVYTALHLDVPRKTRWYHLLGQKTKWVFVTLFAPEIAVFVAASQLRYAWGLRSKLRRIQKEGQASNWRPAANFEINLKYAFFIIMGAVRFDVHDILSLGDLNNSDRQYFPDDGRRNTVRPGPAAIIQLAERGHWIQISKQDIDDKSKADTIQKALVVIQVLWMITQCIARRIYDLPLSILEIHTIVHVVCAIFLYACWFEKPLNIQEAMVVQTQDFRGDLAVMLQRHFYTEVSCQMELFPPKAEDDAAPPVDLDGSPMKWVEPRSGVIMYEGVVLPSGLALSKFKVKKLRSSQTYRYDKNCNRAGTSFVLESSFLARWDAILSTVTLEGREGLEGAMLHDNHGGIQYSVPNRTFFFLARSKELEPKLGSDWEKLFWEGGSIMHLEWNDTARESGTWKESITKLDMDLFSLRFFVLAMVLSGLYGGVHLTIWGQAFPSYVDELMWKASCFIIIGYVPFFPLLFVINFPVFFLLDLWNIRAEWTTKDVIDVFITWVCGLYLALSLVYIAARVSIIVESFLSLRQSPVGVYLSPEWVELFPHF